MKALAALAFALVCAVLAAPASAQGRDNPYVVAGVTADATAANANEARTLALANANRTGFERLVRRLTAPSDFGRVGVPALTPEQLENLVVSFDVEDERRSTTRYIARLTLRFNADQTRAVLRNAGYVPIEARSAPMVVIPQAPGADEETAAAWREAWVSSGLHTELVPLVTSNLPLTGSDWAAVAPAAQAASAGAALIAVLRVQASTASAALTELTATGRRDRGTVTARIEGGDQRSAFARLAAQASEPIQNDYKTRVSTGGGGRGRIAASALYQQQAEWERIKQGLERAAASTISEIRIEAVGRAGALVSFSYTGNQSGLVEELRRQGVTLEVTEIGPVLRAVAQRR